MTTQAEASVAEHFKEKGALGVITKPFDPLELAAVIRAIWIQEPSSNDDQ
jgi:DNA-binding response OmpR family regulator